MVMAQHDTKETCRCLHRHLHSCIGIQARFWNTSLAMDDSHCTISHHFSCWECTRNLAFLCDFWWLWHGITHCGPEDYPRSFSLLLWAHKNGLAAIQKQWMTSLNPHHPICWAGSHLKGLESVRMFGNEFWLFCGPAWHQRGLQMHS